MLSTFPLVSCNLPPLSPNLCKYGTHFMFPLLVMIATSTDLYRWQTTLSDGPQQTDI